MAAGDSAAFSLQAWAGKCISEYLLSFYNQLLQRVSLTFQLTVSEALLEEAPLHVRTFSRSGLLLGKGRVEE